jgi:hypothetical protein
MAIILYGDDTKHVPGIEELALMGFRQPFGRGIRVPVKGKNYVIQGYRADSLIMAELIMDDSDICPPIDVAVLSAFNIKGTASGRIKYATPSYLEVTRNESNVPKVEKGHFDKQFMCDFTDLEDRVSEDIDHLAKTVRKRVDNAMGLPLVMIQSKIHE